MPGLADRMLRAARLDVSLYEEVERDRAAMGQAMTVVLLSAVAAGLGSARTGGPLALLVVAVIALAGWYVWAYLTYFIGTRILPEPRTRADHGELLRTLGFASSPGVLRILGIIPGLTALVSLVAAIWMLVATVIAVRQALDYTSTLRAVGVCIIGWLIQAVLLAVALALFGAGMPGRPA